MHAHKADPFLLNIKLSQGQFGNVREPGAAAVHVQVQHWDLKSDLLRKSTDGTMLLLELSVMLRTSTWTPMLHIKVFTAYLQMAQLMISLSQIHAERGISLQEVDTDRGMSFPQIHAEWGMSLQQIHAEREMSLPQIHAEREIGLLWIPAEMKMSLPQVHAEREAAEPSIAAMHQQSSTGLELHEKHAKMLCTY